MNSLALTGFIWLCLILLEGFFSGSEIALVSSDPKYIKGRGKELVLKFLDKPEKLLAITLVGTNLCVISNTALTTALLIKNLGTHGEVIAFFLLPPSLLLLGEIIPKTIAQRYANYLAPYCAWGLKISGWLLAPLVFFFAGVARVISSVTGKGGFEKRPFFTKEELKFLIRKDELEIHLSKKERHFFNRLFSFTEKDVRKAMVPLVEVVSLPDTATVEDAIRLFTQYHYSRLPVYKQRVDQIVGIVHYLDLLFAKNKRDAIKTYIKPAYFVPETKAVHLLLKEMQRQKQPLAVVVDEYGGAVGIVHIEDLLEEITGEIQDEEEISPIFYKKIGPKRYLIKGRMEIENINEQLPFSLPEGEYDTLNGFIINYLGKIPKEGDVFKYKNLRFKIVKANPRRVEEVEVSIE